MSNLRTSNQTKLEDYPPGVQCLLKDAMWHVEQLRRLKLEFRAWQAAQGETGTAAVHVVNSQGQEVEMFAPRGHPESWTPVAPSTQGNKPARPKVLPAESSIQPPPQCLAD